MLFTPVRRRRRRYLLRVLLPLIVLGGGHVYFWWRLFLPLPSPAWQLGTVLVALGGPSFIFAIRRGRTLPREPGRKWILGGYLWFGFATYFFLAAIGSHVADALGATAREAAVGGIVAGLAVVGGGLVHVARGPLVRRVRVPLAKQRVPYTIVHLTDVHIGPLIGRAFAEQLVARVNALAPDAIVLTGDIVDGPLSELQHHVEPLGELRARDGVFAVTGNHEYYWNAEAWVAHLGSLGIRVLRNEHVTIGGALQLAGVDDSSATEDVPRAVAGRDPERPLVLLAHHPRTIHRARIHGVALQLSGHTHGGQLLPFGWLARIWDPKVSGLARYGQTWLYVSDGTGYWGPPLRVGTSCEIAAITLVPA